MKNPRYYNIGFFFFVQYENKEKQNEVTRKPSFWTHSFSDNFKREFCLTFARECNNIIQYILL